GPAAPIALARTNGGDPWRLSLRVARPTVGDAAIGASGCVVRWRGGRRVRGGGGVHCVVAQVGRRRLACRRARGGCFDNRRRGSANPFVVAALAGGVSVAVPALAVQRPGGTRPVDE